MPLAAYLAIEPFAFGELGLRLVGAFYLFAGVVAVRAATMDRFLDQALAGLTLESTPQVEKLRGLWLLVASLLVGASGLALIMLSELALWLFLLSAAGQAAFLFYFAPRYFDVVDAPDPKGRRGSINAFLLYCVATAFVVIAAATGVLKNWEALPPFLSEAVAVAFIGWVAVVVYKFLQPLGKNKDSRARTTNFLDLDDTESWSIQTYSLPATLTLAPTWHGIPLRDPDTMQPVDRDFWEDKVDPTLRNEVDEWLHQFRTGDLVETDGHAHFRDENKQVTWHAKGQRLVEKIQNELGVETVHFVANVQPWPLLAPPRTVRVMAEEYCWALWNIGDDGASNICPEQLGITGLIARDFINFCIAYDDGYYQQTYSEDDGRPDLMDLEKKATHDLGYRLQQALKAHKVSGFDVLVWEAGAGNVPPRPPAEV